MIVKKILEHKGYGVVSLHSFDCTGYAIEVLASNNIGAIVICDGDRVRGILSERDIIRQMAKTGDKLMSLNVIDIATRDVSVCTEDDSIEDVLQEMNRGHIRHMPVVRDGALVGIVSIGDVVARRIAEAVGEVNAIREYINTN